MDSFETVTCPPTSSKPFCHHSACYDTVTSLLIILYIHMILWPHWQTHDTIVAPYLLISEQVQFQTSVCGNTPKHCIYSLCLIETNKHNFWQLNWTPLPLFPQHRSDTPVQLFPPFLFSATVLQVKNNVLDIIGSYLVMKRTCQLIKAGGAIKAQRILIKIIYLTWL